MMGLAAMARATKSPEWLDQLSQCTRMQCCFNVTMFVVLAIIEVSVSLLAEHQLST